MSEMKHCFGDGGEQAPHAASADDFSKDQTRPDGLAAYCKACAASRQRAWKRAHPEQVKAAKRAYRAKQKETRC